MVNDPPVVDAASICAQPNKTAKKTNNDIRADGSREKSPTGRGRTSHKCFSIYHK